MGYRMAANLRAKLGSSVKLVINDLDKDVCNTFVHEYSHHGQIDVAATAKDAAESASTVVSIVTASPHVKAVYLDETNGVIAATPNKERLFLECSTIDLLTTQSVRDKLAAAGTGVYIDTPVSVCIASAIL